MDTVLSLPRAALALLVAACCVLAAHAWGVIRVHRGVSRDAALADQARTFMLDVSRRIQALEDLPASLEARWVRLRGDFEGLAQGLEATLDATERKRRQIAARKPGADGGAAPAVDPGDGDAMTNVLRSLKRFGER